MHQECNYNIEDATKTEQFISIAGDNNSLHLYKYDNKQLMFAATVYPATDGYNPILYHRESVFKRVNNLTVAVKILKTYYPGKIKVISKMKAHELLCP